MLDIKEPVLRTVVVSICNEIKAEISFAVNANFIFGGFYLKRR